MHKNDSVQEDISTLKLILVHAKNLRDEDYEDIDKNAEQVWKQISLLTFLAGTFFAFAKFGYNLKLETAIVFFLIAYFYVLAAFLFSLYEIYPRYRKRRMTPDALNQQCDYDVEAVLNKLITTYLINSRDVRALSQTTIFVRKCITVLSLGFVLQITIIIYYYISNLLDLNLFLSFILLSIILTWLVCCYEEKKEKEGAIDND